MMHDFKRSLDKAYLASAGEHSLDYSILEMLAYKVLNDESFCTVVTLCGLTNPLPNCKTMFYNKLFEVFNTFEVHISILLSEIGRSGGNIFNKQTTKEARGTFYEASNELVSKPKQNHVQHSAGVAPDRRTASTKYSKTNNANDSPAVPDSTGWAHMLSISRVSVLCIILDFQNLLQSGSLQNLKAFLRKVYSKECYDIGKTHNPTCDSAKESERLRDDQAKALADSISLCIPHIVAAAKKFSGIYQIFLNYIALNKSNTSKTKDASLVNNLATDGKLISEKFVQCLEFAGSLRDLLQHPASTLGNIHEMESRHLLSEFEPLQKDGSCPNSNVVSIAMRSSHRATSSRNAAASSSGSYSTQFVSSCSCSQSPYEELGSAVVSPPEKDTKSLLGDQSGTVSQVKCVRPSLPATAFSTSNNFGTFLSCITKKLVMHQVGDEAGNNALSSNSDKSVGSLLQEHSNLLSHPHKSDVVEQHSSPKKNEGNNGANGFDKAASMPNQKCESSQHEGIIALLRGFDATLQTLRALLLFWGVKLNKLLPCPFLKQLFLKDLDGGRGEISKYSAASSATVEEALNASFSNSTFESNVAHERNPTECSAATTATIVDVELEQMHGIKKTASDVDAPQAVKYGTFNSALDEAEADTLCSELAEDKSWSETLEDSVANMIVLTCSESLSKAAEVAAYSAERNPRVAGALEANPFRVSEADCTRMPCANESSLSLSATCEIDAEAKSLTPLLANTCEPTNVSCASKPETDQLLNAKQHNGSTFNPRKPQRYVVLPLDAKCSRSAARCSSYDSPCVGTALRVNSENTLKDKIKAVENGVPKSHNFEIAYPKESCDAFNPLQSSEKSSVAVPKGSVPTNAIRSLANAEERKEIEVSSVQVTFPERERNEGNKFVYNSITVNPNTRRKKKRHSEETAASHDHAKSPATVSSTESWSSQAKEKLPQGNVQHQESVACLSVTSRRSRWTFEEEADLVNAVNLFGVGHWRIIESKLKQGSVHRSNAQLKDKWTNLLKYGHISRRRNGASCKWVLDSSN